MDTLLSGMARRTQDSANHPSWYSEQQASGIVRLLAALVLIAGVFGALDLASAPGHVETAVAHATQIEGN